MKKSKILAIFIALIVCFVAIGAVSAVEIADTVDDEIVPDDIAINEANDENTNISITLNDTYEYGKNIEVTAKLTYENGTPISGQKIIFDLSRGEQSTWNYKTTNENGIAIYTFIASAIEKNLFNPFIGEYNITVSYEGNSTIGTNKSINKTSITINSAVTKLFINVDDTTYGNNLTYNGKLTYTDGTGINNKTINIEIFDATGKSIKNATAKTNANGIFTGQISGCSDKIGNYNFTATFDGTFNETTELFKSSDNETTYNVNKIPTTMTLDIEDIIYGENGELTIQLNPKLNTNVSLYIDGQLYLGQPVTLTNGSATITLAKFVAGKHVILATYEGDEQYKESRALKTWTVEKVTTKIDTNIDDSIFYGENTTLYINMTPKLNTTVTIYINGELYIGNATLENGEGKLDIINWNAGEYVILVAFLGDDNYKSYRTTDRLTIKQLTTTITTQINDTVYGKTETLEIFMNPEIDTIVDVYVDGSRFLPGVEITNGYGKVNITKDAGEHLIIVRFDGNTNYRASSAVEKFIVYKQPTNLEMYIEDVTYGEKTTLYIAMDPELDTYIEVSIDGNKIIGGVQLVNGQAALNITANQAGKHIIVAKFLETENYLAAISTKFWTVEKQRTHIDVDIENTEYGKNNTAIITMDPQLTTRLIVRVDGILVLDGVDIINGTGVMNLSMMNAGIHSIMVTFEGDENYVPYTTTHLWTVSKASTKITADIEDITYGEEATLTINMEPKLTTDVTVFVDGFILAGGVHLEDGYGEVKFKNYNAGEHIITVRFDGGNNYVTSTSSKIWTINKQSTNLNVEVEDVAYNETTEIIVTMDPQINTTVNVFVDGNMLLGGLDLTDGYGIIRLNNLTTGNHVVNVVFGENKNYFASSAQDTWTVNDVTIKIMELTKYYGADDKLQAQLLDAYGEAMPNETIIFTVNGVTYYRLTDKNGIASLAINLNAGQYIVRAAYDILHYAYSDIDIMTTTETNDITLMYRNGTRFEAIFSDSEGNPIVNTGVAFNINGVFYTRTTDENGAASIAINLAPGEYTITTFNTVTGEQKSNKITVLSPVVGTDLTKKYSEKAAYEVCAYDNQGNALANATITININGVFYQRITDDYGIARLNINLAPGEYIATAAFNGALTSNIITVLDA